MNRATISFLGGIFLLSTACVQDNSVNKKTPEIYLQPEIDTIIIGSKNFSISTISKSDFDKIPGKDFEACVGDCIIDQDKVKRKNNSLVFSLSNKKTAILKDNNNEEDFEHYAKYRYISNLEDIGQWLIKGEYYEGYDWLLIDHQNGDTTFLPGTPSISPNKKYFICGSESANIIGINRICLFENTNKKPKLIGDRELKTWGPSLLKWIDNTTLVSEIIQDTLTKYIKIEIQ